MKPRPGDADEPLDARLERLERELTEADRLYNEALTALDQAKTTTFETPHPPPGYETARLADLEREMDPLGAGWPGGVKGRLARLILRLIGPAFGRQRTFNQALVEHLHRLSAVSEARRQAAASTIDFCRDRITEIAHFQLQMMVLLQRVTPYVDTRMRSAAAAADLFNRSLDAVSDNFHKRWASLEARQARTAAEVGTQAGALDDVRRAAALAQQTALSLKREVERLFERAAAVPSNAEGETGNGVAAGTSPADLNSFKYLGFENEFRGAPEQIRRRLEAYLPLFAGRSDIVDVGCGRGEFLDLLRSAGVTGRGIDTNDAMVEETRARGLAADKADALGYVRSLPDDSIGGIFAAQVIEHLPPDYLTAFVEEAARKIRPGGIIVLETINPACWVAFFESYIRDLTHVRPLHPETMQYLLRVSGFSPVEVRYSSPVDQEARLASMLPPAAEEATTLTELIETFNANVDRLNARLYGFQDYAVIGYRPE
jgi:SAM-dependent methyltransferase